MIARVALALLLLTSVLSADASAKSHRKRPMCFGERATIVAEGGEVLGTRRDDVIVGTDGIDRIYGRGGDDLICGRRGDPDLGLREWLDGGGGRDRIKGGIGTGTFWGGAGADLVIAGHGIHGLLGEGGSDILRGRKGLDGLTGGPGNDLMIGGGGRQFHDTAAFVEAPRHIHADLSRGVATGWGRDTLRGIESLTGSSRAPNTLIGDRRRNVLNGSIHDDVLEAGGGDDVIDGKGGDDVIDGGPGIDRIDFPDETEINDLMVGVEVDLLTGRATMGPHSARLKGIEDIEGTEFEDVLRGDHGPNWIFLGETVEGRGGDDRLQGGEIDGGDGYDVCEGPQTVNCEAEGDVYRRLHRPA